MKKILFLLLICVVKLSAYEVQLSGLEQYGNYETSYWLITNENNKLKIIHYKNNEIDVNQDANSFSTYSVLSNVRNTYLGNSLNTLYGYLLNNDFIKTYKKDEYFLNDLYTQATNQFLNYLYNENNFTSTNFIEYNNYELLYNSDGLAVESVLNGSWAGLYDGPDQSGYLYDEKGDLKYINGVSPSFFESIFNKLMRKFGINLQSIFIRKIFYPLLILIFACVVLRAVIRLSFKVFLIRFYDKKIGQLEKRREKIENA